MPGGISFSAVFFDKSQKRIVRYFKSHIDNLGKFMEENATVAKKNILLCNFFNSSVPSSFFVPGDISFIYDLTATKEAAEKLIAIDASVLVSLHEKVDISAVEEDDPYAEFAVPDDLIW